MDRTEEYTALLRDLEELPPALAGTVGRAKARRRRLRLRRCLAPAGSAAAVFAAFVLAVNLWTPFALACGRVPILKELAAAVAFSPTLKTAVEHDYVQYIGQRRTDNGVTMELEYVMADQGQLVFFVSFTGPEEVTSFMPLAEFVTADGEKLEGCSVMTSSLDPGELSNAVTAVFNGEEEPVLPEELRLECRVECHIPGASTPGRFREDAAFTFTFPLDEQFRGQGRTVEVDRWLDLDGNRIRVASLELYPTHARLNLEQDPDNAETLTGLSFYLEDGSGVRYEQGSANGLTAMGDSYLFESPYFSDCSSLTLCITGAEWLEKGREYAAIDLEAGEALSPLPQGVEVSVHRAENGAVWLAFLAPEPPGTAEDGHASYQICTTDYRAPDGTEGDTGGLSRYSDSVLWPSTADETPIPKGWFAEEYDLGNYPWDTVEMELCFTRRTYLQAPLALAIP